jgi:hypothetical protein
LVWLLSYARSRECAPEAAREMQTHPEFRHGTLQKSRTRGKLADTKVEDPDLWRFLHDSAAEIGVPPTVVPDGRTPFEVFRDVRFLVLSPRRQLSKPGR